MKGYKVTRRDFIYLGAGAGLLLAGYPFVKAISQTGAREGQAFAPTPSNTLGPFYRRGAPRRDKLVETFASAKPLQVSGKVIGTEGKPLAGATIEVFHADATGNYDMSGFNCRGEIPVTASGEYRFESIMPRQYGGRPQHIHYVISAPGHRRLITQLYFANDPFFEGNPDRNYTRDSLVEHRELIRPVEAITKNGSTYASVLFDICLEKI